MADYEEEPQISPGLIYALVAALRGQAAPTVPVTQGAMGIAGSVGPGAGFRQLAARGPRVQISPELSEALGGGFSRPGSSLGQPSIREARGAAGRGDIPSAEYAASTEAPGGRASLGAPPAGNRTGGVYELPAETQYADLMSQVRDIPAPAVDLNDPALLRNRALFERMNNPAKYVGYQEGYGKVRGSNIFNLSADLTDEAGNVLHPAGSTVWENTLNKYGIPKQLPSD